MKPEEKAKELVDKMKSKLFSDGIFDAKQCALISVDEIIEAIDWHAFESPNVQFEYWDQVKQEIQKL